LLLRVEVEGELPQHHDPIINRQQSLFREDGRRETVLEKATESREDVGDLWPVCTVCGKIAARDLRNSILPLPNASASAGVTLNSWTVSSRANCPTGTAPFPRGSND
jgi:hypothetical protein